MSVNNGRQKPSRMRGSGRPVMRNVTLGIPDMSCPRTEGVTKAGSSSLQGLVGDPWIRPDQRDRKSGSLCASWTVMVGEIKWRLPLSSTAEIVL
jgi:hypothetical protein